MNTIRDLNLLPVWVNPQHLVLSALHMMIGHKVKALAVVEGDRLVGSVSLEDLIAAPEGSRVADVMKGQAMQVEAGADVRTVAQAFASEQADLAMVTDGTHYIGMLTPAMLLRELGRSYDPLTGLSWSDQLREWAVEHLRNSEEVTIIFIDLNHFGIYNKKYGHIVGDQVIQKVARFLSDNIDPEFDVLVRYGGDEFAIGTQRDRDESDAFAELLEKRFDGKMKGADEPVTFSTGVFGGRRHKERENTHYAATVDNLISIASKNCIANKRKQRGEEPELKAGQVAPTHFAVLGIYSDESVANGITTVIISGNGNVYSGADSKGEKSIVESIAAATARAVEKTQPGTQFDVRAIDLLQEGEIQVVTVTALRKDGYSERTLSSAKRVAGELANAVAETTIETFIS
jgi:diguanylate cyclase (GGDEF)-like protein